MNEHQEQDHLREEISLSRLRNLHAATLELLGLLASHRLEQDLLQKGIDTLTALIGARYGAIGIVDEAGKLQQFVYSGITPDEAKNIGRLPEGCGLLGVVIHENHVLRLDDMKQDPRSVGFPPHHPPVKSLLAVPVSREGRVYGRVYLSDKTDDSPFDDHDEILTQRYAEALALVLAYHRSEAAQTREEEALLEIAEAISCVTGENLFNEMVIHLAKTLQMDFAFIGELDSQGRAVHTTAFCADGKTVDNLTYELRGTPCENVIDQQQFCVYPSRIQQQFPEDRPLVEMGIESYMGAPLFNSAGRAMGLLTLMSRRPIGDHRHAEGLLRICAARVAAELERLRSEQTLRESEERFRATFNQAAVGIAHVAPDGRWLRVNQKLCEIVGYTEAELLQRTFQDITHPDDLDTDLEYVRQVLAGEIRTYSMEKRYFRKDGSIVWINLTVSLVRDAQNNPKYFISVVEDITERKKTEDTLARFGRILDSSSNEIYIFSADSLRFMQVNQGARRNLGYAMEELKSLTPLDLKPEFTQESFEALVAPLRHDEQDMVVFETVHKRKDGSLYPVEVRLQLSRNEAPPVFVAIIQDITERKRAEKALAQSTAEWTYSMDFIEDVMYLIDTDDKVLRANRAFYRLTGLAPEQVIGRDITSIMHPHGEADPCPVCRARRERRDANITLEADNPINPVGKPIEVMIRMVRDDAGNVTRVVMGIHDLSRARAAEEELRTSRTSLAEAQRIAHIGNWERNVVTDEMHWSDETYRIFGLVPHQPEATFEMFLELIHPDDRQLVVEAVSKAVREKQPYDLDYRIVRPDGTERIVHVQAEPGLSGNGKVERLIGTVQDVTEYCRALERLHYLANYDTLTDLPNRVLLQDRLSQAMLEADRRDRLVAVMFLDLDRFKIINDTLGHDVGDALLKEVANRLTACVRVGDTISRLGGDEFTVVLANVAHVDDVARMAQKIIDSFAPPFIVDGRELFVSPSIGITLYPFDDNSIESLLRNADAAMYHAKETGRNNFRFYTAELNRRTAKRLALETALRHALERNELLLHYQPQVNLKTGKIIGAEALVRWQHPEMGLIPPLDFIPLAEETGLIIPIGEWVLRTACVQTQAWHRAGFHRFQIAVNLSGRQFQHRNLAKLVEKVLKETGLDPRQLDLELTESLLMHNTGDTLTAMNELHAHGVAFSMDDFGTGYSSLSYLKRFPIDTLKIDRSFVRDIPADPDDAAIAQATIAMAHGLGIKVIAEGVETAKQLAFMRANKCDAMQGYYFSKPVPAAVMMRLLQKDRRLMLRKTAPARKKSTSGKAHRHIKRYS